jgi:hypothetical protein
MNQDDVFAGAWQATHWYPTKDDSSEESSVYDMVAHKAAGHDLVLQSNPKEDGSYMLIRLSIDDNVATGTWYENTSPKGDFESAMYSGAGQMIISDDKKTMTGMWAGAGMDHKTGGPRIYTGRWELKKS